MPNIKTIDFNLLRTFDVLYEERNVTRAARRLHVSQSTVSGTLARLRSLFNDPLFVRQQGGMLPTPRAETLAPRVRRLLVDLERALEPAAFDPATAELTVAISANDYGQAVLLVPLIERVARLAPRLRLAIMPFEVAELGDKLAKREIDIAVTVPEMAPPDYPARFLFADRYVGVVRQDHPVRGAEISLDAFCSYPHVLVSPTGGSFIGVTDKALLDVGRRRDVKISVPNFRLVFDLLQIGDFIAVIPEMTLRDRPPGVRKLELPIEVKGPDAIIVWHPRVQDDPAYVWLREQIVETAQARVRAQAPGALG